MKMPWKWLKFQNRINVMVKGGIRLTFTNKDNEAIIKRLRRIEGQVKGIQKMVEEENIVEIY